MRRLGLQRPGRLIGRKTSERGILMNLFSTKKGPVIVKETSAAKEQLQQLEELLLAAPQDIKPEIEQDMNLLRYGIFGEDQIMFELKNSYMPMYVLHDLYLEDEGLTAQIDFLIITEKVNFVVECKNLIGNIEINNSGDFIRTINYGKAYKKEGIYSPVTQNRRHLELIKKIRGRTKTNFFSKALFENNFDTLYQSIVVLANPKTVLNDKYARKEIKEQVIRVDRLIDHIRQVNAKLKDEPSSDRHMAELAEFFLSVHKENTTDYLAKYKVIPPIDCVTDQPAIEKAVEPKVEPVQEISEAGTAGYTPLCPKCSTPMVLRTAKKGERAGKQFWGCGKYLKCRSIINLE